MNRKFETNETPTINNTLNLSPENLSNKPKKEEYISSAISTKPLAKQYCDMNRPPLRFDRDFFYNRNNQIKIIQIVIDDRLGDSLNFLKK